MPLPIDAILPQLLAQLARCDTVILQAEPGAGKTTRVPLALLEAEWLQGRRMVMLEPRRLAAVHAARYLSRQLGEEPGQTVGYTIRHQRAVSDQTRLEVVTEGILTRRLQNDPALDGVGLLIFDEFHERALQADLGLALVGDVRAALRPDLKVLVMSATLDGAALADFFGGCPLVVCGGRSHPVTVTHLGDDSAALELQVSRAVQLAVARQPGDVLVFLPGAREIQRCQQALAGRLSDDVVLMPLYGALPFEQQQQALQPAARRKVVLATNIAETSLTIEGVRQVIDSGLERLLTFESRTGMNRLVTRRISLASARQRTGRAGRMAPGACYRLWSPQSEAAMSDYVPAEIVRSDLTALALELIAWGVSGADALQWLDAPPRAHLEAAFRLLQQLDAIDGQRRLTAVGRAMCRLSLHPRLARMLVAAQDEAEQVLACQLAVLLESPQGFRSGAAARDGDLFDQLESWQPHRRTLSSPGFQPAEQTYRQLCRRLGCCPTTAPSNHPDVMARLLLAAYPDRLARQRDHSPEQFLLSNGRGARLSPRCRLRRQRWLVAVDVEFSSAGEALIHSACALAEGRLESVWPQPLPWHRETVWDEAGQRVLTREVQRWGALLLTERPLPLDGEAALALVLQRIRLGGLERLGWSQEAERLWQRMRFVQQHRLVADWPQVDERALLDRLEQWLAPWLGGMSRLEQVLKLDLAEPLASLLTWPQLQLLDTLAPERLSVPSGSRIAIDYSDPQQPLLAVKLQELFGWQQTPVIGGGRVALLIQLLSPARRPMQTTRDLANFWATTYAEVRKELKGRYPKHPWPDDPLTAVASHRTVKKNV
ncbi:ATP-dependent helicase HrpB [Desulfuromonas thiophila]|uniref:ATP-dependent helicase HrpB n=1 Tax=Desulfuromonas thiophila TaxID=57664 RepID=UPI0024A8C306|nr:ATP-dependent helicase HrpB [Desulfuromonas thiophila]